MADLPNPGDPLVTIEGHAVFPEESGQAPARADELMRVVDPEVQTQVRRHTVDDLPYSGGELVFASVVLSLHVLGLSDIDIAEVTRTDQELVSNYRKSDKFKQMYQLLYNQVIDINSDQLSAKIAAYSGPAVDKIVEIMNKAKNQNTALRAAQDLANRAMLRPQDNLERKQTSGKSGGLSISVYTKDEDDSTKVEVNFDGLNRDA